MANSPDSPAASGEGQGGVLQLGAPARREGLDFVGQREICTGRSPSPTRPASSRQARARAISAILRGPSSSTFAVRKRRNDAALPVASRGGWYRSCSRLSRWRTRSSRVKPPPRRAASRCAAPRARRFRPRGRPPCHTVDDLAISCGRWRCPPAMALIGAGIRGKSNICVSDFRNITWYHTIQRPFVRKAP